MFAFGDTRLPLRFWHKVLPCDDGCWFWIGAISSNGYGSFGAGDRRTVNVHRYAYLTLVGPVMAGLELDHLCRDRACCNPAHLEPVTKLVNVLRGDAGRHHSEKTHCPQGHPYDERNTIFRTDRIGSRDCRACKNIANRELRARKRDAIVRPLTETEFEALDRLFAEAA